ncbi:MAG TPA: type VI secretion system protein TssA [Gemmataceae bacterium]|nr:type VI secretion system protein TssA [Gemmataceae bacterium]
MASPETLDVKQLAAPVAGPNPAGADLRAEAGPGSLYYRVKDARTAARAAERRELTGEADAPPPDWRPVLQHGVEALAGKSKDLEIAAYVVEALVRLHGFAGLRDGFRLTRELIDAFWDGLYPLPDEDGLETRLAPLAGLNGVDSEGTLPAPILRVPISDGPDGRLSSAHYQEAQALAKTTDVKVREKKVAAGATTPEALQKAVAETPPAFFRTLVEDLTQCQEEFGKLCAALEKRCGADQTPPSSNIRNALTTCLDVIKDAARDKLQAQATNGVTNGQAPATHAAGSPAPPAPPNEVCTREDAFRELLKLADFFRRTEPQAVLSYALEQVVRWGKLSLPELMMELIPEEAPRKSLFKQVGIRPEPKAEAAKK